MNENLAYADACGQKDLSRILTHNRSAYTKAMFDLDGWERLSDKIAAYMPHYVISAARKMPRLVQLLQSGSEPLFNFDAIFVSDFAIEYLASELKDKRIAVLDDSLNVGSTFRHIVERLSRYGIEGCECFCLTRKDGCGQAFPGNTTMLECYHDDHIDEATYRKNATKLSMGLWMLNRPLECEFPVFVIRDLPEDVLNNLEEFFKKAGKLVQQINMPDAVNYGFRRFNLIRDVENGLNEKIRFYVDSLIHELVIVPMAYSYQPDLSPAERIRERFLASMLMFKNFSSDLPQPGTIEFLQDEAALLFGAEEAKVMANLWKGKILPERRSLKAPRIFYEEEWPKIKPLCKIKDLCFLNDCFVGIFNAIADFYKADSGHDYERLCKGLTFEELVKILKEFWTTTTQGLNALPSRLSQLLDEHIDNGFVVPMTDRTGRRIFRKGEPYAWHRAAREVLAFVQEEFNPANDLNMAIEQLPPEDKQRFIKMMLRLEETLA